MNRTSTENRPFLKWAGGKRWLTSKGLPKPSHFSRLVEPFVGGGAVCFYLAPTSALLCDINSELINLYQVVRDTPNKIEALMLRHQMNHSKEYYYRVRSQTENDPIERAARMLYLNRTCWNGLYRVNKKGQFNVPVGTKNTVLFPGEKMESYSEVLRAADLKVQDFEVTIDSCDATDFIFADPPYTVKHNANGFIKYNETIFSWDDQVRLHKSLCRAALRGSRIAVTNANHESIHELYKDGFKFQELDRYSVLSSSASHRNMTSEALFIANFDL